jgi:hypothetical protein
MTKLIGYFCDYMRTRLKMGMSVGLLLHETVGYRSNFKYITLTVAAPIHCDWSAE